MTIQVATEAPAPKRRVHVLKLPEPPLAPVFNPLASEEVTNAFFQHVINATITGM
jgi:hypothetical protein